MARLKQLIVEIPPRIIRLLGVQRYLLSQWFIVCASSKYLSNNGLVWESILFH